MKAKMAYLPKPVKINRANTTAKTTQNIISTGSSLMQDYTKMNFLYLNPVIFKE
jgi:hypothetical protein